MHGKNSSCLSVLPVGLKHMMRMIFLHLYVHCYYQVQVFQTRKLDFLISIFFLFLFTVTLSWLLRFEFVLASSKDFLSESSSSKNKGSWKAPTKIAVKTRKWETPIKIYKA